MPLPTPTADESQSDFASRCHDALSGEYPETDQRNKVCFAQWRDSRGRTDGVERKAREKFGNEKFVKVTDVPVFAEHVSEDKDGNKIVYDKAALELIAARCNDRILDTADFAPLTLGHTPTEDEIASGAEMPEIGGYAGNFRLGMIGNRKPRWAIFQDEYHHAEDAARLQKHPRRSVEIWTEDRMEDRFFDPIAALGAETPRLDMGMAYARRPNAVGKLVKKYAAPRTKVRYAAVASAPGAMTSPKKFGSNGQGKAPYDPTKSVLRPDKAIENKKRHASDGSGAPPAQPAGAPNPESGTGGGFTMTPDDAQMVVNAIEQLPWVMWVKEKMEGEESGSGSSSGGSGSGSSGSPSFSSGSGSPSESSSGGSGSGSPSGSPSFSSGSGSPSHHHDSSGHGSPSKSKRFAAGDFGNPSGEPSPSKSPSGSPEPEKKPFAAGKKSKKKKPYASEPTATDPDGGAMGGQTTDGVPADPSKNARGKKYGAGTIEGNILNTTGQTVEGNPVNNGTGTVADPKLMKLAREKDKKDRFRRLERRLEKVETENTQLRHERVAALRYSRLSDLKSAGFIFEVAEELEDTAAFSDEQFDRHCKRIPQRYTRAPVAERQLFVPQNIPGDDKKPGASDEARGKRVKEKHEMYRKAEENAVRRGEKAVHKSYAEIVDEVETEFRGKTKAV